jgi:predicted O-methyltransferase YrrM
VIDDRAIEQWRNCRFGFEKTRGHQVLRSAARRLRHFVRKRSRERRRAAAVADMDPEFWPLHEACHAATKPSAERLYALYKVVEYIVRHDIPGDFVECGVWRGGSVMMMALALRKFGGLGRRLYCFDTFEGMSQPGPRDVRHNTGELAADILRDRSHVFWAVAALDVVRENLAKTGYPAELVTYCKGKVEDTLLSAAPGRIALLRLDTDWYESTKHELVHLYPRLAVGGVLIIDDYGFWRGARQATDEYFRDTPSAMLLNRIDDSGRIGVKASQ